jgi:hypothetical protein
MCTSFVFIVLFFLFNCIIYLNYLNGMWTSSFVMKLISKLKPFSLLSVVFLNVNNASKKIMFRLNQSHRSVDP